MVDAESHKASEILDTAATMSHGPVNDGDYLRSDRVMSGVVSRLCEHEIVGVQISVHDDIRDDFPVLF